MKVNNCLAKIESLITDQMEETAMWNMIEAQIRAFELNGQEAATIRGEYC
jgi:hypothetical protein